MKRLLLILPVLGLAGCAGQHPDSTAMTAVDHGDVTSENIREPGRVHTYLVNDYIDPNNPRVLHRGHPVEVVEQDEKWNLDSASDPDEGTGNYGPVPAADDPNATPNPYSAEFETELVQQRSQYQQLAALGTQMTVEMGKLEDMAEKQADAVSEDAALRTRLEDLQREIDELKTSPATPVNPNAPKNASWFDWFSSPFRVTPPATTAAEPKADFRTNLVLRPAEPPAPASNLSTTPPPAPANAPDEMPSPGETANPKNSQPTSHDQHP